MPGTSATIPLATSATYLTSFASLEVAEMGFFSAVFLSVAVGALADALRKHFIPFCLTFFKSLYSRHFKK